MTYVLFSGIELIFMGDAWLLGLLLWELKMWKKCVRWEVGGPILHLVGGGCGASSGERRVDVSIACRYLIPTAGSAARLRT